MKPWCVIDFETEAIGLRPLDFPPKSVGVAVWQEDAFPIYMAYGHPTQNNFTKADAAAVLEKLAKTHRLITHNGCSFDMVILFEEFGIPWPKVHDWEDTLILAYLYDPYAASLSLKDLAPALCNIQPVERDELRQWILENVPGSTAKNFGAHIAKAPGHLVGKYACADVTMTKAVYDFLRPKMIDTDTPEIRIAEDYRVPMTFNMEPAYYREKRLAPILAKQERIGIRVDRTRLENDLATYGRELTIITNNIRAMLDAPGLEIDSDAALCDALTAKFPDAVWGRTEKGARSTSKENLRKTFGNIPIIDLLIHRASLATCVRTFMGPWLELSKHDGRLHPRWNQVRGERGGTRTGRLSCDSPNLANVPKEFPSAPMGYTALPVLRDYLLPELGCVWLRTDAMQQELRALAHYENGALLHTFNTDPTADMHVLAQTLIQVTLGMELTRKAVKTVAFSIMYGAGIGLLADRLGVDDNQASQIKKAYLTALPGIASLQNALKTLARAGAPFRTIGGRRYFVEPPREDAKGKWRSFDYKMLNTLIQGSAGDLMKQAIINYYHDKDRKGTFLLSVYDELNVSVPITEAAWVEAEAQMVQEAFARVDIDVPMLSDSSWGATYGTSEAHPLGVLLGADK